MKRTVRRRKRPVLSALQLRALETSVALSAGQMRRAQTQLVYKQHHSGTSVYVVPRD